MQKNHCCKIIDAICLEETTVWENKELLRELTPELCLASLRRHTQLREAKVPHLILGPPPLLTLPLSLPSFPSKHRTLQRSLKPPFLIRVYYNATIHVWSHLKGLRVCLVKGSHPLKNRKRQTTPRSFTQVTPLCKCKVIHLKPQKVIW